MVSSVLIQEGVNVDKKFEDEVAKKFRADIIRANFRKDPTIAITKIREWASGETHGMIKEMIIKIIRTDPSMICVNANGFQGHWNLAFKREAPEKFYNNGSQDNVSDVHLMHQKRSLHFLKDSNLKAKFLQLDYDDEHFTMIFVLPSSKITLQHLENKFSHEAFSNAVRSMSLENVDVALPIFGMETCLHQNDKLTKFGIKDIFHLQANFLNIAQKICVSSVVQKTVMKFQDTGCEESRELSSSPSITKRFPADRPFLFFITEKNSGIILFIGYNTSCPGGH